MNHFRIASFLLVALFSTTAWAAAPEVRDTSPVSWDLELDPIAYALSGHSVHVGITWEALRLDLGTFGLALPEALHGNKGFDARFRGYGAKLDVFVFSPLEGLFLGVEGSWSTLEIQHASSGANEDTSVVNLGVRGGYRVPLGAGFFVSPWVGVGYAMGKDVRIGGDTFAHKSLAIFPTVHLGYRAP